MSDKVTEWLGVIGLSIGVAAVLFAMILISCGVVCLITWGIIACFGMEFNIRIGIGIWLIMLLLRLTFNNLSGKKS